MNDRYHHGDLRSALLREALVMVEEVGPSGVSLRELARRTKVSHGAPAHHFRDRRALLTALASQSLHLLASEVRNATPRGFDEAAVAYVRFARENPGRYAVMYRDDLLDSADPEFESARAESMAALLEGVTSIPEERRPELSLDEAAHVAWSLVHGLASLPARAFGSREEPDDEVVRRAARQLFG